jgi:hypothetical protein
MTTIDTRTPEDKAKERAWDAQYKAQMEYMATMIADMIDKSPEEGAERDAMDAVLAFIDDEIAIKQADIDDIDNGIPTR